MADDFKIEEYKTKMIKTYSLYLKDLSALRTGRASATMLDIIKVDVYGQKMPLNQLGTITVPEPRMITVQVWDENNVSLVESALRKSELSINPQSDGQLIRIPIPDLTEERRGELKKIIKGLSEKSKISIRNIRREGNDKIKKQLKENDISEDIAKKFEKEIQVVTDNQIKQIEITSEKKEKEIMSV